MKKCTKCDETKPEEFFNWKVKGVARSTHCKECHSAYRKRHYEANRDKYIAKAKARTARVGRRYEKYGLTDAQWEELLSKFDGLCWICQVEPATHVDHDHACCPAATTCGSCVRGALCNGCNSGLGFFRDNVTTIRKAIEYLGS